MVNIIRNGILLAEHCSFRIGGTAKMFSEPTGCSELIQLLQQCLDKGFNPIIFGYGSNTLFPDIPRENDCFISFKKMCGVNKSDINADEDISKTGAISLLSGTPLSLLSLIGIVTGTDFDFTYLLPGSIGAAVSINARYKDREMSDVVKRVHYINIDSPQEGVKIINAEDCNFSYKHSVFQEKEKYVITAVDVSLKADDIDIKNSHNDNYIKVIDSFSDEIKGNGLDICNIVLFNKYFRDIKQRINPSKLSSFSSIEEHRDKYYHFDYPSAGSVFKNSRELGKPIGEIIDNLQLKGKRCGDAQISPHHGNIIINNGKASADDVRKLIDEITEKIFKVYGFEPELEIKII